MKDLIASVLGAVVALAFLWFLYEIIRLERWPGRFWHHAYIGLVLALLGWFLIDSAWLALLMFVIAFLLIYDDAGQHHTHNRLKRMGIPPERWPVSWLHRKYEAVARSIT